MVVLAAKYFIDPPSNQLFQMSLEQLTDYRLCVIAFVAGFYFG
jgi:hypothetical protein